MKFALLSTIALSGISAHMDIKNPPARTSKFSEYWRKIGKVDYDLNAPLSTYVSIKPHYIIIKSLIY
jgi:hypothetical protein